MISKTSRCVTPAGRQIVRLVSAKPAVIEACLVTEAIFAARNHIQRCLQLGNKPGTSFHCGTVQAFLVLALLSQGRLQEALKRGEAVVATASERAVKPDHVRIR